MVKQHEHMFYLDLKGYFHLLSLNAEYHFYFSYAKYAAGCIFRLFFFAALICLCQRLFSYDQEKKKGRGQLTIMNRYHIMN